MAIRPRRHEGDEDFIVAVGKFSTDTAQHAMTKVAGEVGAAVKTSQDAARTHRERSGSHFRAGSRGRGDTDSIGQADREEFADGVHVLGRATSAIRPGGLG